MSRWMGGWMILVLANISNTDGHEVDGATQSSSFTDRECPLYSCRPAKCERPTKALIARAQK